MIIAAESGGSGAFNLLLLLAIPLVFYFLLIRPQNKRRKEQLQMESNLQPGSRVMTTSGMRATVLSVDDDGVLLEIAPGVEVSFVKQAVMRVIQDDDAKGADAEELDLDEDDDDADDERDGGTVDLTKDDATEDDADDAEDEDDAEDGDDRAKAKTGAKAGRKSSD
ncbi:preprotein translocase subunit YajC [Actinomadura sp. CNU-125]|nr:preprotein translocase subunit YajC [Actinomadura sp. CNU-125]